MGGLPGELTTFGLAKPVADDVAPHFYVHIVLFAQLRETGDGKDAEFLIRRRRIRSSHGVSTTFASSVLSSTTPRRAEEAVARCATPRLQAFSMSPMTLSSALKISKEVVQQQAVQKLSSGQCELNTSCHGRLLVS